MAFIRPVEIRFFPRLPRVSPCFILWGFLFSVVLTTSLVSLFFPFLFECVTTPNNTQDDIKHSEGPEFDELDRIAHIAAGNEIADPINFAHVQHSHVLASPTLAASTTTTSTTTSALKVFITRSPLSSPQALLHRRQNPKDRLDDDGFPHFGDDVAESRISKNVNVYGQPIQTVRLDDVRPFPMGTENEIPGVFAACAQPCTKKAVELNTDCEDPLDLECTCRPEVRAVIEAASDECCWQACDDGTPEPYWRPCWHEDDPLHY